MEESITLGEFLLLTLSLGSIVYVALLAGSLLILRKQLRFSWWTSSVSAIAATALAFVLTVVFWAALGAFPFDLPEPLFTLGGTVNSLALVASTIMFAILYRVASRRAMRAASGRP